MFDWLRRRWAAADETNQTTIAVRIHDDLLLAMMKDESGELREALHAQFDHALQDAWEQVAIRAL